MLCFVEGKRHDASMLKDSGLLQDLGQYAFSTTGTPMCIYGDPAYPLRIHLQGPFRDAILTPQKEMYNYSMSSVGTSVEWLFGDIQNYFKFIDFKKNLKVGLSSVGKCMQFQPYCVMHSHVYMEMKRQSISSWIPQAYKIILFDCKDCLTSEDFKVTTEVLH